MSPPSKLIRRFPILCVAPLAAAVLFVAGSASVRADVATKSVEKPQKESDDKKKKEKKKFDFLPEARNVEARFVSGGQVVVELVAAVPTLRPVEFLIRQAPTNGKLSGIQVDLREGNKAVVIYTHDGGNVALTDTFTYACRMDGGSWSAPATVTLTGQRMEPKIEVVNIPQFSRVYLGGESSARVSLRNTGTADFRMDLKWPALFIGPAAVEVPKNGTTEFQVFVKPSKTGDFRHEVFFQEGVQPSRAIFYATCVQALSVSPSRLTLTMDPSTGERSGVLSLANARLQPVQVVMNRPARLLVPEKTEVAGGARSDLRIALPAGDVEEFAGDIVVISGDDMQKVSVTAAPKPAALQVLVPANHTLDFGIVDQRAPTSREVVLNNAGGQILIVEPRVRPPYSLGETTKSIRLEPRGQARLKVSLQTEQLGVMSGELELSSNATRAVVKLAAEVRENQSPAVTLASSSTSNVSPAVTSPLVMPASPPSVGAAQQSSSEARSELQSVLFALAASRGVPIPANLINPHLASITSMELVSASSTTVTIAWPKPAVVPPGWIIETAVPLRDPVSGIIMKMWQRYRDWETVEVDGDRVAVRLQNLAPASIYEIRVMAVDREGKVSEPTVSMVTQTELPWRVPPWTWRLLMVVALGFLVHWLYRVRQNGGFRRVAQARSLPAATALSPQV